MKSNPPAINYFRVFKNQQFSFDLPQKFTFPFYYQPHSIALLAAKEIQEYLAHQVDFEHNFESTGKMFGVLVAKDHYGNIGYLAAFSGKLADSNEHIRFVPPVFDLLEKDNFFNRGMSELNSISDELKLAENDEKYLDLVHAQKKLIVNSAEEIKKIKSEIKIGKAKRDAVRNYLKDKTEEEREQLLEDLRKQSVKEQYFLKDFTQNIKQQLATIAEQLSGLEENIHRLKEQRKNQSNQLQQQIFDQYTFLNQQKDSKSIGEIFIDTFEKKPPAGAGECAAPKLLQYAFLHDLTPIALAEFWWGASPSSEIRVHGQYYPACKGKCEPILKHMLDGIELDENPLLQAIKIEKELEILFEDDYLLAINKPAELLSVPGRQVDYSVYSIIKEKYPKATGPLVIHRLDQSTSGIMLLAKDEKTYKFIQRQFIKRKIKKRYFAILNGEIAAKSGTINLPLRLDIEDRPRQLVCYDHGKEAITEFEVLKIEQGKTQIHFYPKTGRTHQLRVHAAHVLGLNAPIIGDDLYGTKSDRLHLHANYLQFLHPQTREMVEIECEAPF
ncbi:MAG: RluA family pseudouridine synthase [Bacteroidota bacterium]